MVMRSLKTEACGDRSGDLCTEFETMEVVPLEKTTAVIDELEARDLRAGGTSGKVESES